MNPEVTELEKRAHNLGEAIAVATWSMTLGIQLEAVEERLAHLRAVAEALDAQEARSVEAPSTDQLKGYFKELGALVDAARTTGTGNPKT